MVVSPTSWNYAGAMGYGTTYPRVSYSVQTYQPPANEPFRLVYYGDVHENYKAFPRLKTAFQHFVAEGKRMGAQVLQGCTGDSNTGKESHELELNTKLNDQIMNPALAPVVQSEGNHDFDAGCRARSYSLATSHNATMVSNVSVEPSNPLYARIMDQKFLTTPQVIPMPGGGKYGAIGVTVPSAKRYMNGETDMAGISFMDMPETIARIQAQIDWLEQVAGVNKVVLTTHIGFEDTQKLAKKLRGVDVILSGHDHVERFGVKPGVNYVESGRGEPVMIVNAGGLGEYMGVFDGSWDPWGRIVPHQNQLYKVDQFEKDAVSTQLIEQYLGHEAPLGYIADEVSTKNARVGGENAVANSVADAIKTATRADIAFFRGTELRANVDDGEFSSRDLNNLLPFSDNLALLSMTGVDIMRVLQESGRCLKEKESHPGIIHAGGLRYGVDKQTGAIVMAQVKQGAGWVPLNPQSRYQVAVGQYALNNKSEYTMFQAGPVLQKFEFNARQIFGAFLQSRHNEPLGFQLDGRLKVIDGAPDFAAQARRFAAARVR